MTFDVAKVERLRGQQRPAEIDGKPAAGLESGFEQNTEGHRRGAVLLPAAVLPKVPGFRGHVIFAFHPSAGLQNPHLPVDPADSGREKKRRSRQASHMGAVIKPAQHRPEGVRRFPKGPG